MLLIRWTRCSQLLKYLFITYIVILVVPILLLKSSKLVPLRQLVQHRQSSAAVIHCQRCNDIRNSTPALNERYLIIGAISHPGYIITSILREYQNLTTIVTEDISSLGFDSGTWRHYDRLKIEVNVTPSIVDYSDHNVLKSQLEWIQGGTVVYIPSLLFNAINKDSFFDVNYISSIIKNFSNLLEVLTSMICTCGKNRITKIVYFTPKSKNVQSNQHATVLRLLSLVLSSYSHAIKNIKVVLISFTACTDTVPHNMLGCNRNDPSIIQAIQSAVLTEGPLQYSEIQMKCCNNVAPYSAKEQSATIPVADREYIVGVKIQVDGSQLKDNSFLYMHGFYLSCVKQNLDMLIFHNNLNNEFQKKLSQFHPNNTIVFVDIDKHGGLGGRRDNDARYFFLFDYLLDHPEIKALVFQDLKDGAFYMNPFRVMDGIGSNILFAGTDRAFYVAPAFHEVTQEKFLNCSKKEIETGLADLQPFYNAGTFGGSRDVILTYIQRSLLYLETTPPQYRCNMVTNYLVMQSHFRDHSYSGYPFQTYHGAHFGIPRGVAIKHREIYPYDMKLMPGP